MNLKVALLLSGQPRFYDSVCYNTIKKEILDVYDVDVFFHCWYKDEKYEYDFAPWSEINGKLRSSKNTIIDLIKMYNPKDYLFEEPRDFSNELKNVAKITNFGDLYLLNSLPSMLYSLKKSNELLIKYKKVYPAIKYDFIIRARFDTLLYNLPDLNKLERNIFYVPDNCPNPNVYNDNFSIYGSCGEYECKEIYDLYSKLEDYVKKVGLIPEHVLKEHLNCLNIKVEKLPKSFYQNFSRK